MAGHEFVPEFQCKRGTFNFAQANVYFLACDSRKQIIRQATDLGGNRLIPRHLRAVLPTMFLYRGLHDCEPLVRLLCFARGFIFFGLERC
jgi:hypothetical protein